MSAPDRRDLSQLRAGRLRDVPFGFLLQAFSAGKRTLSFELQRAQIRKTIVVEDGIPVACRSNLVHETLGQLLVNEGRLSAFQCKECVALAVERGVRIGELLEEMGLIERGELRAALKRNLARKLLECFTWSDGAFHVLSELPETEELNRINLPRLIFTGITRFAPQEQVSRGIGGLIGRQLSLRPTPDGVLDEIRWSLKQRRLLSRLRRPVPTEELFRGGRMSKNEVARVLYALLVMGLLTSAGPPAEEIEIVLDVPVDEPSGFAAAAAPPLSAAEDGEALCDEIRREHAAYRDREPSEILRTSPQATPEELRRRYVDLCSRYAPERFEAPELRPLAELAAELLSITVRGYDALKKTGGPPEPEPRAAESGPSARPSPQPDADSPELAAEYAREAFKRMEIDNFDAASGLFSLAVNSDRENVAYRVELAYARFRDAPEHADESLDVLLSLAGRDGADTRIHLYAAEIAHHLGDFNTAKEYFLRGCALWIGEAELTVEP